MDNFLVIELLSKESRIPVSEIHPDSTLLKDLKLDGDDAWEVFVQLHDNLGLDLSEFAFEKYFRNEPCFKGPKYLFKKMKGKTEYEASGKTPIKVIELVEACRVGKW